MIDSAEKDPELGLLHLNEMNQMEMHQSADAAHGRSGTGGGSMIRVGGHNNQNYTGWGGSGESTGGSARHY